MKTRKLSCILITNKNSWVSEPIIEELFSENSIELKSVIFYSAKKNWKLIKKRLLQYGFSKFFWKMVDVLKNKSTFIISNKNKSSVKTSFQNVKFNNIPFEISTDLNSIDTINFINKLNPDVVLVCSCSQIFKAPFLQNNEITFLNFHDSLLPLHKGPSPSFWVLFNEEKETGYTIHRIVEKIDAGEIIFQEKVKVENVFTEEELIVKVVKQASKRIVEILLNLRANKFEIDLNLKSSYERLPTLKQRKQLLKNLKSIK